MIDTAGFDIEIKHDLIGSGPLIKKGLGTLTISGANPFTEDRIFVYAGKAVVGGVTYEENAQDDVDASAGGYLGEMVIHGTEMEAWLNDADFNTCGKYGAQGAKALDLPRPVVINAGGDRKTYTNLEVGILTNDTENGISYSFSTEGLAPRTFKVAAPACDPVKNVRDFGGWPLLGGSGATTRQGVILRGGHLDSFVNVTPAQQAASALSWLKTEIDLRHPDRNEIDAGYQNVSKSWAAVDADYVSCPIDFSTGGAQIDTDDPNFTNPLRRVFSALGTPGALPAYVHGGAGADRTGVVGLLLLGLTGVDEDALFRDYLASNFADIGGPRSGDVPQEFLMYILSGSCNDGKYVFSGNAYGESVAARCRAYLEMCGVTYGE
ncbi:MAG: tyrosine-protein phosphatase, partial [Clostridia bacterium]|nr:tyrosine-protein phosphatase [Clostridia bacterium]